MRLLEWLLSAVVQLFGSGRNRSSGDTIAAEKEAGTFEGEYASRARDFESDYNAAVKLLKNRLDKRYPSGHYGRLRAGENNPYNYGEERAEAVDTMSIAIAMALRDGATVKEAAEAGAASVGI
ncbi:hypothetical protein MKK69_30815 [Methylobacterium sp. J-026]|uniref:hypothetical protein n=1 Tax=Methylobacterium sp. J-026 TaxID=2836624 RepID=UPI001FB861E2|nr:hypothetical protein [Methylobacterium sp. J-026]MCJ2138397.1 hypothetical protein [Methylobacterium sp. J-026]